MTDPMHGAGDEFAQIRISLRVGGPPRVSFDGTVEAEDLRQVGQYLRDWAGHRRPDRANELWVERQRWKVERALAEVSAEVKRADYERARPLRCGYCRQRFKHEESLSRHVVARHTAHWGKAGRTLCGLHEHEVLALPVGQLAARLALCDDCLAAADERVGCDVTTTALADQLTLAPAAAVER